eukprot:CAMPEP_0172912768 /NCGR_PEP_ID=MMETSP1075-20121228/189085_1 /TAXON_ID=2916 /ORGANISM="Ceratium fusus, Strain PA161109" /LENGTH=57 /DNA_ID=CAMNT_0013771335 /DNA_START=1 /DNA_END=170 /DNA_ORIENTATION=-
MLAPTPSNSARILGDTGFLGDTGLFVLPLERVSHRAETRWPFAPVTTSQGSLRPHAT